MTDKIERQYRYSPEVCHMLEVSSVMIGRTMEDTSAIAIRALYETVRSRGNVFASAATEDELITEIKEMISQRPDLVHVIQKTLSTFMTI